MLFDFQEYIGSLREDNEKKEIVEKYEKLVGPIVGDLKDQIWYKDYISKFETVPYKVPEDLVEDFDWDLLMQLVAGSFSSDGLLEFNEGEELPEFLISVVSGDASVVKKVSELWGFQIKRLYEIYVEEQMSLQTLMAEDEKEKEIIESQRVSRLERWQRVIDKIKSEKEKIEEEKERQKKLDELKKLL